MKNCFYNGDKGSVVGGGGVQVGGGEKGRNVSSKKDKSGVGKKGGKLASDFINNKLKNCNKYDFLYRDGPKTDRTAGQRDTYPTGRDTTGFLEKSKESKNFISVL